VWTAAVHGHDAHQHLPEPERHEDRHLLRDGRVRRARSVSIATTTTTTSAPARSGCWTRSSTLPSARVSSTLLQVGQSSYNTGAPGFAGTFQHRSGSAARDGAAPFDDSLADVDFSLAPRWAMACSAEPLRERHGRHDAIGHASVLGLGGLRWLGPRDTAYVGLWRTGPARTAIRRTPL
jgi:hypothetical protein